jgi:hypothetical protein
LHRNLQVLLFPNIDSTIEVSLSNFGRIPYGYNLVGRVFFDPKNIETDYACRQLPFIGENHPVDESPIVMVHRGNCSFVTKVRNVENAGGHVALIIDNKDEDVSRVVMADDGRGRELTIPAVLISREHGQILTDFYTQNPDRARDIIVEVDFEMEHPNNTVSYNLYTTADNEIVYRLLTDFYRYHEELNSKTKLKVHYVTYQHPLYDSENPSNNAVKPNCLGNGKYCASPGKYDTTDGRVIVYEAIKQKCIYNYAYDNGLERDYWNYIYNFYTNCLNTTQPEFTRECSATTIKLMRLPEDVINKCVHDSFIAKDDYERKAEDFELRAENTLLNADNQSRITYLLSYIPSITINGRTFWGSWRAENLFEALCAGFKKKPEVCFSEGAFTRHKRLGWFGLIIIILLIIAVNLVIFYFCKNYIRRKIVERIESTDINHKINTVVTSYLALRDNK